MNRTTKEVFESHLQLRLEGKIAEDIERNYASDVVLLSSIKRFTGKDGVKESADDLSRDIGDAKFEYVKKEIEGEFAFLIWKARSETIRVEHGVDSFLIRDGKILVQSIFYALQHNS